MGLTVMGKSQIESLLAQNPNPVDYRFKSRRSNLELKSQIIASNLKSLDSNQISSLQKLHNFSVFTNFQKKKDYWAVGNIVRFLLQALNNVDVDTRKGHIVKCHTGFILLQ